MMAARPVTPASPLHWLAAGWADLRRNPLPGLVHGGLITAFGALLLLLGLLCIKPHLFLPLGLFVLWKGNRMLIAGAVTSVLILMAVATLWFSPEIWLAFLESLSLARAGVEHGYLPWLQMSSLFSGLRQWGMPIKLSHMLQMTWGLLGLVISWRLITKTSDWQLQWAVSISCGLMLSPFLYQYDMVLLAVPLVLLVMCAQRDGLPDGQAYAFIAVGLLPALDYFNLTHINWLLPLAILTLCWRHMKHTAASKNKCNAAVNALSLTFTQRSR